MEQSHWPTQTEKAFGYSREELVGHAVETLIPERFRRKHVEQRRQYSSSPTVRPMGADLDLFGRRKDGTEFPVEISLSPFHYEQESYVLSSIRDVSHRKQIEVRLRGALAEVTELRDHHDGGL